MIEIPVHIPTQLTMNNSWRKQLGRSGLGWFFVEEAADKLLKKVMHNYFTVKDKVRDKISPVLEGEVVESNPIRFVVRWYAGTEEEFDQHCDTLERI